MKGFFKLYFGMKGGSTIFSVVESKDSDEEQERDAEFHYVITQSTLQPDPWSLILVYKSQKDDVEVMCVYELANDEHYSCEEDRQLAESRG